jgi:myo-inositol-1(or 4)-monophosphatase
LLYSSIRAIGSAAINLCLVAEGACDAYFEYGVHIWDYGKNKLFDFLFYDPFFSSLAAGDLIAREAGAYTCDPSGAALNLIHRRILCTASKELAEQISPLLTHIDFPHD